MKEMKPANLQPKVTQHSDNSVFDASDVLNSTEVEEDDLGLSGYVQDNFDFLDQMDCSVLDHMDCSVPYQVCVVYLTVKLKLFSLSLLLTSCLSLSVR